MQKYSTSFPSFGGRDKEWGNIACSYFHRNIFGSLKTSTGWIAVSDLCIVDTPTGAVEQQELHNNGPQKQ